MNRHRGTKPWTLGCLLTLGASMGWPAIGRAAGTWSVISFPQRPGEVVRPQALAADAAGNLYLVDFANGSGEIQQRDAQGAWSVIAAAGTLSGQVGYTAALAVDPAGDLYVADQGNCRIQKRNPQGRWSLVAGFGDALGQVDGLTALAVDTGGNLYVADEQGIQKRDAQGNWSLIAILGSDLGQVYFPTALAVDTGGNLYVADGLYPSDRIQKREAQGNWSLIAAGGDAISQVDGPTALAADPAGNLYVADLKRIQKRDAQGNWSLIAPFGSDLGQVRELDGSWGNLAADTVGNLYVADAPYDPGAAQIDYRIQKRDAQGRWSAIDTYGAALGQVDGPSALAVDRTGNLYVADGNYASYYPSRRIQKRDAQGNWSLIAGGGAALGQVSGPPALTVDAAGNLYVADQNSGLIQKRDSQGQWSALGQVDSPTALAVDTAGSLYVAEANCDLGGCASLLQKRDAQGNWSILATRGVAPGQVDYPTGLAVDTAGGLYVAEAPLGYGGNNRIQKRDAQGNWSVIARQGAFSLAADSAGNLYALGGPLAGGSLQKRDAQGNWSVVATGGAYPSAFAVDPAGNLYVADLGNNRVLEYMPGGSP